MMTKKEKRRVPELRFPGFEGEWEKKELRKAASINPKNDELPDSFIYIDLESVNNGVLDKEERVLKKDAPSRAQRLLERNDILYQTVRPYQKNNLYFDKEDKDYVASTGYAQLRTDNNSRYLYQYIHTDLFVNKVLLRCTGTSYPAINSTDLSKINVSIPSKEEQQKIATFLTSIDTRIQQLEKKKTLLEQYKKGVMQRIFSQEIRFKRDDGEEFPKWEKKRLGDIGVFKSGIGFSNSEQGGKVGIPFYKVSDMNLIGNEDIMKSSNNYVTQTQIGELKYNVIKENSIIFAKVGAAIFLERKRLASNFLIDNNMMAFTPKFNVDFCKYLFHTLRLAKYAQVGALPSYNASDLKIIKVEIPTSLAEQTKIAHFLSALDEKIAVVNEQVELTKEWKKGLLQRMFV